MPVRTDQVVDEYLKPVPGATVYVLKSDGSQALSAGVTADEFGFYTYTVPDGKYVELVWYAGKYRAKNQIIVGVAPEFKGDPGGNIMAIGTYAEAAAGNPGIPNGTKMVQTSGYSTDGDGGHAIFFYSATMPVDGPRFQDASGRWFGILRSPISSRAFGVLDSLPDAGPKMNEFLAFIAAHDECREVHLVGNLTVSTPMVHDNLANEEIPREIHWGGLNVTATGSGSILLKIKNDYHFNFVGRPTFKGTGNSAYASRTWDMAVWLESSSRVDFGGINAMFFRYFGVYFAATNSTLADIGNCSFYDIGSGVGLTDGDTAKDLRGTWSNPINDGAQFDAAQRTSIDVSVLPPTSFDTYGRPAYIDTGSDLFQVMSIDRINNRLSVHPWIPSSVSPGSFTYIFGAGVSLSGTDNGIVKGSVDSKRCGMAAFTGVTYSPKFDRIVSQNCAIGFSLGDDPTDASQGGSIDAFYVENTKWHINRGTFQNANIAIGNEYGLDLTKVVSTGTPRNATGTLAGPPILATFDLFKGGTRYQQQKLTWNNGDETSSKLAGFTPTLPKGSGVVYRKDSWNIELGAFADEVNKLFGVDSAFLGFIGTGTGGAQSGNFVFKPRLGDAINGLPAEAVSNYATSGAWATFTPKGPVLFLIYRNVAAKMWYIWPVGGMVRGVAVTDPAAMTYVAATGGATIDTQARAAQAQLAADVTSIRTALVALTASLRGGGEIS